MSLLGCFLNTVVIRCAFSRDLPFTELLSRTRNATLGALSHDGVPFELLVQKFMRTPRSEPGAARPGPNRRGTAIGVPSRKAGPSLTWMSIRARPSSISNWAWMIARKD